MRMRFLGCTGSRAGQQAGSSGGTGSAGDWEAARTEWIDGAYAIARIRDPVAHQLLAALVGEQGQQWICWDAVQGMGNSAGVCNHRRGIAGGTRRFIWNDSEETEDPEGAQEEGGAIEGGRLFLATEKI